MKLLTTVPLLVFLFLVSLQPVLATQTTSQQLQNSVLVDRQVFSSTVPSYMVVGQNYTVQVRITNALQTTVPVAVEVVVPLNFMVVQPLLFQYNLTPGKTVSASFTLVAYQTHVGALNVTAEVWITNFTTGIPQSPILKVNAQIFVISRPTTLGVGILVIVIIAGSLLAIGYRRRARRN